jgi:hypothetical protein
MISRGLLARLTNTMTRSLWLVVVPLSVLNSACALAVPNVNPGTSGEPIVSISSPASSATVSGTITVTANASDTVATVAIASVQFQVDGSNLGPPKKTTPYLASLNSTTLSNGNHKLTAVATDKSNHKATSTAVSITVSNSNNTPQSVSITSPASGATVSGTITVTANATDSAGIASVQFEVDGSHIGAADTASPYSASLNTTTLSNGKHTLTAVATDKSNSEAKSAGVSINVNNKSTVPNSPTVSITSPSSGVTVSGTITVTATASDSSGIASVQFLVDGSNLGPAITALPYSQSWNSTTAADGPHTVSAVAKSNNPSETLAAATVSVVVQNGSTPPSVPQLSSAAGWYKILGTTLTGGSENATPCPPDGFRGYQPRPGGLANGFAGLCFDVIGDPSAAALDTKRNRMLLWGGGHFDYGGNEVYSLEINQIGNTPISSTTFGPLIRLTNPGPPNLVNAPVETLPAATSLPQANFGPGGPFPDPSRPTPNSRHLYDAWFYIPTLDAAMQVGGALNATGGASNATWTLAMNSVDTSCSPDCDPNWQNLGFSYSLPGTGTMAHWDPNTNYIWMYGSNIGNSLYVMSASNMVGWTLVGSGFNRQGYHSDGVIDTDRDYFVHVGNNPPSDGVGYWPLAGYQIGSGTQVAHVTPTLDGSCVNMMSIWSSLQNSTTITTSYVGINYDPIGHRIVMWPGTGNTIWYMDTGTWTCTSETYGSTKGTDFPQDTDTENDPSATGTFTRFGYFPAYDIFVLCNDPRNDCWYLRLNRGTPPVTVSITSPASGATVSGTITVTGTATAAAGVLSVQFLLDGANLGMADTMSPYSASWDTTKTSNGSHVLTAIATDTLNHQATSANVLITVNNTSTPPVMVSITSPASGTAVSGTITVSATASAGAGVASVQFLLDGAGLGSQDTSSPYSVSWDTTTASNGSHVLAAKATDTSGNSATSSNVNITVSQSGPPPPPPAGDDVTISDPSGSGQTNRAVSIARAFVQGEIADFAQASINGSTLLTQCDVKNRWPDGSLKFAVVSFVVPNIPANGSVVISFSNQASGNNTGYLAESDMMAAIYNFDGQIQLTGAASHNISARSILSAAGSCNDPGSDPDGAPFECRYWLKGPIVTAVILEDRTGRSFDVNADGGSGNPLHPIFEAWFYPQGNMVQLGYTLENSWASATPSNSARDQKYSVVLTGGNSSPATEFMTGSFTHITRSRWHRTFCVNGPGTGSANACGPLLHINRNWAYLAETKFTPHWDPNLTVAASKVSGELNGFASTNQTLAGNANGIGYYPGPNQGGMNATGAAEYHGPLTTWDIITLMTQDPGMLNVTLGNADLGNAIPYFYREADANAGHGQTFDKSGIPGNVPTQGRVVSINARTQVSLLDTTAQGCNDDFAADWINFGTGGQDAGVWGTGQLDTSHWPNLAYTAYLMTGQYAYYEEQLMQSAYAIAASPGSRACTQPTNNQSLRMGSAGYWYVDQERGTDWMARENALGAFIAVDGSPEKAYLEDKLRANIAVWEGVHKVPNDLGSSYGTAWTYGNTVRINNLSAAGTILGAWTHGPAVGPNGYAANFPLCLGNTASPCPASQFSDAPQDGNSNFQNAYSAVMIGWINDLGYCPGNCAILGYVFPTLDSSGGEITSWQEDQTFYLPGGQPTSWPNCGAQNPDEWYTGEDMAAMSYFYTMNSSQGGYSGATAYNTLRSAQDALGCVSNAPGADFSTASPKWDITPRATNPSPAP